MNRKKSDPKGRSLKRALCGALLIPYTVVGKEMVCKCCLNTKFWVQNRDPMRPAETQILFEKKMTFWTLEP